MAKNHGIKLRFIVGFEYRAFDKALVLNTNNTLSSSPSPSVFGTEFPSPWCLKEIVFAYCFLGKWLKWPEIKCIFMVIFALKFNTKFAKSVLYLSLLILSRKFCITSTKAYQVKNLFSWKFFFFQFFNCYGIHCIF